MVSSRIQAKVQIFFIKLGYLFDPEALLKSTQPAVWQIRPTAVRRVARIFCGMGGGGGGVRTSVTGTK